MSNAGFPPSGSVSVVSCAADNTIGDLHVVGRSSGGGLYHTIRYANGNWRRFGNVKDQVGDPGPIGVVDTAVIGSDLHVVVTTSDGGLYHTIRYANGTWVPVPGFGDVRAAAGNPGLVLDTSAASTGPLLHVLAITSQSHGLYHAIRLADGNWQPRFGTSVYYNGAGYPGAPGASLDTVSSAVDIIRTGDLFVVGTTSRGGLFFTTRPKGGGSWTRFIDIKAKVGGRDPGTFVESSVAAAK